MISKDIFKIKNFENLQRFFKQIVPTYENSEMIHGMKLTKDGNFARYANTLSDDEIESVIKITKDKIMEAVKNILEGNFSINPKILDGENVSCEFCKFNDICYKKEEDNIYLERGEDDAKLD